ncbi:MAG: Fic family protein [Lachnospiraceae bacterium]|nr:Fic family protein [Lachnospiraceae bacterium]
MFSYKGLEAKLKERGITRSDLTKELGISSRTIAKIGRGEKLSRVVMEKLCAYFSCETEELCREVSSNPILQTLREEKEAKISGGLYHELQVRMTYNSNHIEGSRLTESQTRLIFETNTLSAGDGVLVDDILETVHHFRAIDYVIDCADNVLTEEIIKKLHEILKHDTKDATLDWFAVGNYKKRPNVVGGRETTKPKDVPAKMKALLTDYNAKRDITIQDIISFHAEFEKIHPFQDGNGRVGRLVALKECLRFSIVPFLIEDSKKAFYYRGLSEWDNEKGWLTDTCLDGQDTFKRLLSMFSLPVLPPI